MKWLKFLKAARKRTLEGGAETCAPDDGTAQQKHTKRRSMQHERRERTSIEQWHEARKSRTSTDICSAFNVTTTERLSVCKAGITILINRTYIVIKHLGSGTSGQVKLALNVRSKKLVAIKAVRKSSACGFGAGGGGRDCDARSCDGRGSAGGGLLMRQQGYGGGGGAAAAGGSSGGMGGAAAAAGGGRGWRAMTAASILRRSGSVGIGAWSNSCRDSSSSASRSPPRRFPGRAASASDAPAPPTAPASTAAGATSRPTGHHAPSEELVREIAILKRLSHPNIVQLLEVIDDPASDCLLLVMGYVEGSTLQPPQLAPGRWRPLAEEVAWRYARDVLSGLEYLHCHGVVHGDLKPANFIQDSLTGVVRILDFGSAVLHCRSACAGGLEGLRGAHAGPLSCTPGFRSPESLAAGYRPSFELDMWALGVCLYLWVYGELPFKGSAPFVVYDNIRSAPLALPPHPPVSPQLADLITRLLNKDPASRLTVQQAVQHPWVSVQGLAPLRTASPVVLAARLQIAAAAAEAAGAEWEQQGQHAVAVGRVHSQLPSAFAAGSCGAGSSGVTAAAAAAASEAAPLGAGGVRGGCGGGGGGWVSSARQSELQQGQQQGQQQQPWVATAAAAARSSALPTAGAAWAACAGQAALTATAAAAPPPPSAAAAAAAATAAVTAFVWEGSASSTAPSRRGPAAATAPTSFSAAAAGAAKPAAAAAAAAAAAMMDADGPGPWRLSAVTAAASPLRPATSPGAATAAPKSSLACQQFPPAPAATNSATPMKASANTHSTTPAMPRITEGSSGSAACTGTGMSVANTCSGLVAAAAAAGVAVADCSNGAHAAAAGNGSNGNGNDNGGNGRRRRRSSDLWELRRSVTDEELQAAISSCSDPTGSAAVLMESIFTEVTFPARHQIIRAGDPLEWIYLITAGEVEIYHDLARDGPDAPCPHKPIIEGLSDPESDMDDPGDFLDLRLPGGGRHVPPQLERLSTGLLMRMTSGAAAAASGADRSNHGAGAAGGGGAGEVVKSAEEAAAAAPGHPSSSSAAVVVTAPGAASPSVDACGVSAFAQNDNGVLSLPPQPQPPSNACKGACNSSNANTANANTIHPDTINPNNTSNSTGSNVILFREASSSGMGLLGLPHRTQNGSHLIVASKGPGDSLGFAGMAPGGPEPGRQPVWSANVRARTQVTAFAARIESLHKLARAHPQVEPLLQQIAVQQETDLAVAEAMRSLRLVGGGIGGGGGGGRGRVAGGGGGAESGGGSVAPPDLPGRGKEGGDVMASGGGDTASGVGSGTEATAMSTAGGARTPAAAAAAAAARLLSTKASRSDSSARCGGAGAASGGGGGAVVVGGGGGGSTGMSSEGESESCGTAGTSVTGLTAGSSLTSSLPSRLAAFTSSGPADGASSMASAGDAAAAAAATTVALKAGDARAAAAAAAVEAGPWGSCDMVGESCECPMVDADVMIMG
ncbi:hypothetical protein Agub_g349 [Astrephomene gubernaculifera]|uniref:cGMP-dependent protein kinase n=1 Tax=Astrephomene gubernaculifera TaxID=47775 RepID=A0AAD3DGB3_9CHLO|nr:hypothetical protein Agub_g349 [Astrephomene gubernaculifera]